MKRFILLSVLFVAIPAIKAQKQEIKKAEQAVKAGNLERASSYLLQAKQIFAAADEETRALYYIVEAEMKMANDEMTLDQLASISKSLANAKRYNPGSTLQSRMLQIESNLKNQSAKVALGEFNKNNYSAAATLYNVAYQSSRDTIHFFNAAQSHLLAKEYEEAFTAFRSLFNMGFTDANIRYVATNVETGKKEAFSSTAKRDIAIEQRTHKKPEVVHSSSKVPVLLRGITIAAEKLNRANEAIIVIDNVVADAPKNKRLLNQAFHLYRQLDAKNRYQAIMDQLIQETPNDLNLYYNFGVSSTQSNDVERAKQFYLRALELDPKHHNAKLNLTLLLLDQESAIVNEMNDLGMSEEDENRYNQLKLERVNLYNEVLPYLESIVETQPQDKEWVQKLKSIHLFMGQEGTTALLEKEDE